LNAELILYAVIAAGLVFWLRSVLGTRHGEERERPNPYTAPAPTEKPVAQASATPVSGVETVQGLPLALQPALPRNVSVEGEMAERGLFDIGRIERDFDLAKFAQGAQDAFAVIVEAFAQGDRATLKNLLTDPVYAAFDNVIKDRESRGERVETEIHAVRRAEIIDAKAEGKQASITVRFIADETCVIRDNANLIISGDPDRITEMNDIWTFTRTLKSRDPRWLLSETRDGDVKETDGPAVPDAGNA